VPRQVSPGGLVFYAALFRNIHQNDQNLRQAEWRDDE
jgi:hypothetical protein